MVRTHKSSSLFCLSYPPWPNLWYLCRPVEFFLLNEQLPILANKDYQLLLLLTCSYCMRCITCVTWHYVSFLYKCIIILCFQSVRIRPLAGFALLQAKEAAKRSLVLHSLMRKFFIYVGFLAIVFAINYAPNAGNTAFLLSKSLDEMLVQQQFNKNESFKTISWWVEGNSSVYGLLRNYILNYLCKFCIYMVQLSVSQGLLMLLSNSVLNILPKVTI